MQATIHVTEYPEGEIPLARTSNKKAVIVYICSYIKIITHTLACLRQGSHAHTHAGTDVTYKHVCTLYTQTHIGIHEKSLSCTREKKYLLVFLKDKNEYIRGN